MPKIYLLIPLNDTETDRNAYHSKPGMLLRTSNMSTQPSQGRTLPRASSCCRPTSKQRAKQGHKRIEVYPSVIGHRFFSELVRRTKVTTRQTDGGFVVVRACPIPVFARYFDYTVPFGGLCRRFTGVVAMCIQSCNACERGN